MKRIRRKGKALPLAILLLAGLHSLANAQEYVKYIGVKSHSSIVRCVDREKRLVWHASEHQIFQGFSLYKDNDYGCQIPMLQIPTDISVSDFRMNGNKVYFCGKRKLSDTQYVAILGTFDLQGFPSGSKVYIIPHDNFSEFRRMVAFSKQKRAPDGLRVTETFVMMTAKTQDGKWTIVDAEPIINDYHRVNPDPARWRFQALDTQNDSLASHYFQDITVTSDYVIATSSVKDISSTKYRRYLWYFPLAEIPKVTFLGTPQRVIHSSVAEETLLVQSCGGNDFVTVSLTRSNSMWFGGFSRQIVNIDYFKDLDLMQRTYTNYAGGFSCIKLQDMVWNYGDREMDILVYDSSASESYKRNGHLWHVPETRLTAETRGVVDEHFFEHYKILSLDYCHNDNRSFIASGRHGDEKDEWGVPQDDAPHLFKYKYNSWGECSQSGIIHVDKKRPSTRRYYLSIPWVSTERGRTMLPTTTETTEISTYCETNN